MKIGFAAEDSDETYLGLADNDLQRIRISAMPLLNVTI